MNINAATISSIRLAEQSSAPATPAGGYGQYYLKNDKQPYLLDSTGAESAVLLTRAGSGALAILPSQAAQAGGSFSTPGDAQGSVLIARAATTNATPTELFLDGSAARLTLAANRAFVYQMLVVARRDTGAAVVGWQASGLLSRATGGHVALTGNTLSAIGSVPIGWAFALSADTTNDALQLLATGAASQNIHWVARIALVEVV